MPSYPAIVDPEHSSREMLCTMFGSDLFITNSMLHALFREGYVWTGSLGNEHASFRFFADKKGEYANEQDVLNDIERSFGCSPEKR